MTEQNHENKATLREKHTQYDTELDAAEASLSEALRISFVILKIIMVVLVVVFLVSGFRTVGSDEKALVLRFGKVRGVGENRLLGPGLHWVFPYPIDEIVKIPVAKKVNLPINSFWYHQSQKEMLSQGPKDRIRVPKELNPIRDGYCITRSEKQSRTFAGSADSDYNIVHCKWLLIYQIDDPERFFKNVYVEDAKPGESYAEVIEKSITPLLKNLVEDSVVTTMVNCTIDEAISSKHTIPEHVKRLLQKKLGEIESGITAVSIQLAPSIWPRQVDRAFQASIMASQASQQAISEAKLYAEKTLNEAAGPVAEELLATIKDGTVSSATGSGEKKEKLWSLAAGAAQEKIAHARAYRTKVVESAKANAEYLQKILPEYHKYPELVIQRIYLDAIEYVFNNADEKMVIQPTEGAKGKEIRILINRDPTIKPKSEK